MAASMHTQSSALCKRHQHAPNQQLSVPVNSLPVRHALAFASQPLSQPYELGSNLYPAPLPQRTRVTCAASTLAAPPAESTDALAAGNLPPSLRNNVAVLEARNANAPGGVTRVYTLGMSHVSKVSLDQIRELISLVRPDVVAVEVCKDRLGLMVGSKEEDQTRGVWHCRKILIEGLPKADPDFPTAAQLRPLLKCAPGVPVTTQDIERDVFTLLSTGLFKSVRPVADPAGRLEAPEFIATARQDDGSNSSSSNSSSSLSNKGRDVTPKVVAVPPLGAIRFSVEQRVLPPINELTVRIDSSLKAESVSQAQINAITTEALGSSMFDAPALPAYLKCKAALAALFTRPVVVSFQGVEKGQVEAVVRAAREDDLPYYSGLESSAPGGLGLGIDIFRPNRGAVKISNRMYLPDSVVDKLKAERRSAAAAAAAVAEGKDAAAVQAAANAASQSVAGSGSAGGAADGAVPMTPIRSQFRNWTVEEVEACSPPQLEAQPVADTLSSVLTGAYSRFQADAARKTGVEPGEAWRVAMEAATAVGTQQVLLADRPTFVTERKLSDRVFAASAGRLATSFAAAVATVVVALVQRESWPLPLEGAEVAGGLGVALALSWPVLAPFLEARAFAELPAAGIEDAVAMKEAITQGDLSQPTKLFGEDALLDWPGAMEPIIRDRDLYMAKALAAAASGQQSFCPAFVLDSPRGTQQRTWRFMMPEDAPQGTAPTGLGDGQYQPITDAKAIVAVVGTAHVHGIMREWDRVQSNVDVSELLTIK